MEMLPYDYIKGYAEEFYSKPSYHTREALLNSILNHQQGDDPNFRIRCTDKVVREYNERHEEKIAGKSLLKEIENE